MYCTARTTICVHAELQLPGSDTERIGPATHPSICLKWPRDMMTELTCAAMPGK